MTKAIQQAKSPHETLKPEQQNSAAPPAEPQAGAAQVTPLVSEHHSNSPAAPWVKLLSFFSILRRTPRGKLQHAHPAGYLCWGVSADSNSDRQQIHLSGNIFPPVCLEKGHKILDSGSIKLDKFCCQTSWNALSRNIFLQAVQLMTGGSVRKRARYEDLHILCLVSTLLVRTVVFIW